MTETRTDDESDFPDVSVGRRSALIITAVCAAIYAAVFILLGARAHEDGSVLVASLVLGSVLLILSYFDLRTGLLYDVLTLPLILAGLAWAYIADPESSSRWLNAALGAALGYGLIAGMAYAWRKLRGYEGIGLGDAKLLAAGGAWLGATALPVILLAASVSGMLAVLLVTKKPLSSGQRIAIPFGPSLAMAIWIVWSLTYSNFYLRSVLG